MTFSLPSPLSLLKFPIRNWDVMNTDEPNMPKVVLQTYHNNEIIDEFLTTNLRPQVGIL